MDLDDQITLAPVPEPEKPWVAFVAYKSYLHKPWIAFNKETEKEVMVIRIHQQVVPKRPDGLSMFIRSIQEAGLFLNEAKTDWVAPGMIIRVWLRGL